MVEQCQLGHIVQLLRSLKMVAQVVGGAETIMQKVLVSLGKVMMEVLATLEFIMVLGVVVVTIKVVVFVDLVEVILVEMVVEYMLVLGLVQVMVDMEQDLVAEELTQMVHIIITMVMVVMEQLLLDTLPKNMKLKY